MGYYVTLTDANFIIPADKLDEAYERMCALNSTHHDVKRGGGGGLPPGQDRWFSWMDWNYPETCKDAAEILADLGFECSNTSDGGLSLDWYDSKAGQEDLFLEAIAPLVAEGSYLAWRGEDGAMWRYVVREGHLVRQAARVVYDETEQ